VLRIEDYSFGRMVIDGTVYTSDLIIYPDRIDASWWRDEGHLLGEDDLEAMLEAQPEVVIIGSGSPGMMSVPKALRESAGRGGVEVIVRPTAAAVELYNELAPKKRVVAGFHLTC